MDTAEFARRIRDEHEQVNELAEALRTQTAVVPRAGTEHWLRRLKDRFEHFRAHQYKHMALEEQEGYMTLVVERRPTLSAQVEHLKHEHRQFAHLMDRIHETLEVLEPTDALVAFDCCRRVDQLLSYIDRHENDENLLMTYVFTQDMGAHD